MLTRRPEGVGRVGKRDPAAERDDRIDALVDEEKVQPTMTVRGDHPVVSMTVRPPCPNTL